MAKGGTPLTVFKASRPHRRRGNVSGITFAVFFSRFLCFLAISETEIAHYFFRRNLARNGFYTRRISHKFRYVFVAEKKSESSFLG